MKEDAWEVQTKVKTVRSRDAVQECIVKLLPDHSMRRPFTNGDMEWLDDHSWRIQNNKLFAIRYEDFLSARMGFGVCRYVEHGDYKYLNFGLSWVGKTRLAVITVRRKGKSVAPGVARMAMFVFRELARLNEKKRCS